MKYSKIKHYFEKLLKEEYGISITVSRMWIYNEYSVTITMKKSNKDFLKINKKSYKTYDINEEYMFLILYVAFLELYKTYYEVLFTMEYDVAYLTKNEVLNYCCQRTKRMKFIEKSDLVQAMKDLIVMVEMNKMHEIRNN
jgi:hypothetical protein